MIYKIRMESVEGWAEFFVKQSRTPTIEQLKDFKEEIIKLKEAKGSKNEC